MKILKIETKYRQNYYFRIPDNEPTCDFMIYDSLKEDYVLQDELIDIIYNAHRDLFTNKEMLKIATAKIIDLGDAPYYDGRTNI